MADCRVFRSNNKLDKFIEAFGQNEGTKYYLETEAFMQGTKINFNRSYSTLAKNMALKRIKPYNDKVGVSNYAHFVEKTPGVWKLEYVDVRLSPVNKVSRAEREMVRSTEDKVFTNIVPEEVGDFFMGDRQLSDQEQETYNTYFEEYDDLQDPDLKDLDNISGPQKILMNQKKVLKFWENKLTEKDSNKNEIRVKIELLKKRIEELEAKTSKQNAMKTGELTYKAIKLDLDRIEESLKKDLTPEELFKKAKDLSNVDIYIEGIKDIYNDLGTDSLDKDEKIKLAVLSGDIAEERKRYLHSITVVIAKLANKLGESSMVNLTPEDIAKSTEDISLLSRELLGISYSKAKIVQIIDDIKRRVEANIRKEQRELVTTIKDKIDKLEKHTGLKGDKLWDLFLQKYSNGEWTGNFIGRYKQEFYDERSLQFEKLKEGKISGKDIANWYRNNSHFITEEELESGESEFFTKEEMDEQKRLLEEFEEDKASTRKHLEEQLQDSEGIIDYAAVEKSMEEWVNRNDPKVLSRQFYGKGGVNYSSDRNHYYTLREKPNKKWEDKRFDKIANDPVLLDFYRFMKQTFYENSIKLPRNKFLPGNFLPELPKGFFEKLKDKGLIKTFLSLGTELNEAMMDEVANYINRDIEIGGRKFKSIKSFMMNDTLSTDEKSKDIGAILIAHTAMANAYAQKTKVEPIFTAAQQILEEMGKVDTVQTTGGRKTVRNLFGIVEPKKGKLYNSIKQLEYAIDSFLYDEHKKVEGRIGKVKLSKKEKALKEKLEAQLKNKEITEEQFNDRISRLGKQYTGSSIIDTLSTYTYLNALGLPNFVTPSVNLTFGIASNLIYASGNEDITLTDMRKAINKVTQAVLQRKDINKIWAFMEELGVLDDFNESLYGRKKMLLEDKILFLQNNTERMNRGMMMMAHLYSFKVKDLKGNDLSLYDAFKLENGKLIWREDILGKQETVPESDTHSEHGVNIFRLSSLIEGANRYAHGDYDSSIRLKATTGGRVIGMFKQWLWMAIKYRFGAEGYDPLLQRNTKGRYMVPWTARDAQGNEITTKEFFRILSKAAFTKEGLNSLSKADKAAVRRNLKELQFVVQFTIAVAALSLVAADEDDEETKFALNLVINFLTKAQADLAFFINPSAMAQVVNNIAPLYGTVRNVFSITDVAWKTISGHPNYESGPNRDKNRALVWVGKNMLFSNAAMKMYNYGDRIFEYR